MANSAGVSGPFNPAIGLGTAQANLVIGVPTAGLAAKVTADKWQQASTGNFIGQQSAKAGNLYSQAQGDTPKDFDATFAESTVDNANALKVGVYTRASANQYSFVPGTAGAASAFVLAAAAAGASPRAVTATVTDALGNPVSGVTVNWALGTGSTAGTPAVSGASSVTNASGVATINATAASPGTVVVNGTVTGVGTKTVTATVT